MCLRVPAVNTRFWLTTFPFLIGSVGTLLFDIIILYQGFSYTSPSSSSSALADGTEDDVDHRYIRTVPASSSSYSQPKSRV